MRTGKGRRTTTHAEGGVTMELSFKTPVKIEYVYHGEELIGAIYQELKRETWNVTVIDIIPECTVFNSQEEAKQFVYEWHELSHKKGCE